MMDLLIDMYNVNVAQDTTSTFIVMVEPCLVGRQVQKADS